MDKNIEFIREHGKTIRASLRTSKLSGNKLKMRMDFFRRTLKSIDDKNKVDDIEKKIEDIIQTTGRDQFSEDDIDIIMRQVLKLEIRNYDKSHLVNINSDEVASVFPHPLEDKPYIYGDTTITPMGRLTHKDWRGVEDLVGLTYYKIDRKDTRGKIHSYRIFSHIDIAKMEDDMVYREAVIYGLLDENNITKTNCGGYVGRIQTTQEGKGLEDTVKVNGKYSIVFESIDATAVGKLRKQVEQEQKRKNEEGR